MGIGEEADTRETPAVKTADEGSLSHATPSIANETPKGRYGLKGRVPALPRPQPKTININVMCFDYYYSVGLGSCGY